MKVVLDTNILISGIFWGGKPRLVLEYWRDGRFHLLTTTDILEEYLRVLIKIGHRDEDLVADWTDYITCNSLMVLKTRRLNACRDSDDNKFLECALSADADCIVSGDDDLLVLNGIQGIPIIKPSRFLASLPAGH